VVYDGTSDRRKDGVLHFGHTDIGTFEWGWKQEEFSDYLKEIEILKIEPATPEAFAYADEWDKRKRKMEAADRRRLLKAALDKAGVSIDDIRTIGREGDAARARNDARMLEKAARGAGAGFHAYTRTRPRSIVREQAAMRGHKAVTTLSMSPEVLDFADMQAAKLGISRSKYFDQLVRAGMKQSASTPTRQHINTKAEGRK
jgi:hypothetical protein